MTRKISIRTDNILLVKVLCLHLMRKNAKEELVKESSPTTCNVKTVWKIFWEKHVKQMEIDNWN